MRVHDAAPGGRARDNPTITGLSGEAGRARGGRGDLIVAIGDAGGQLLWTSGSERKHRPARGINFVSGGHRDESSVGTSTLALALRTRQAVRVFAADHPVQTVHDRVCSSAPIREPRTGEVLGVLDFNTTWERSTALGLASTRHDAGLIEGGLTSGQGGRRA